MSREAHWLLRRDQFLDAGLPYDEAARLAWAAVYRLEAARWAHRHGRRAA